MKYKHFCHVDTTVAQHHTCWTFIIERVHASSVALGYLWLIHNSRNFANIL